MFLLNLIDALDQAKIPYALAGGYAVALHGAWRGTIDIDLVVRLTERDFQAVESALLSLGLKPRLPVSAKEVFRFRREYIDNRNLIAWSFSHPDQPSEIVDILIPYDLRKFKTISIPFKDRRIQVLSLRDLIDMKKKSDRPQDREDVKALKMIEKKRNNK